MKSGIKIIALAILLNVLWNVIGGAIAQRDYPVYTFTPYSDATVYREPSLYAPEVGTLPAGIAVTIYTPYVGGDARWWAALDQDRQQWVAVFVNGYCPRERLGEVGF